MVKRSEGAYVLGTGEFHIAPLFLVDGGHHAAALLMHLLVTVRVEALLQLARPGPAVAANMCPGARRPHLQHQPYHDHSQSALCQRLSLLITDLVCRRLSHRQLRVFRNLITKPSARHEREGDTASRWEKSNNKGGSGWGGGKHTCS